MFNCNMAFILYLFIIFPMKSDEYMHIIVIGVWRTVKTAATAASSATLVGPGLAETRVTDRITPMQILALDIPNKLFCTHLCCRWRSQRRRRCQQSNRCLISFWSSTWEEKLSGFLVMTADTHPPMSSQSIPAMSSPAISVPPQKCWICRSHSQHTAWHFGAAISALTVSALGHFGVSHYGTSRTTLALYAAASET